MTRLPPPLPPPALHVMPPHQTRQTPRIEIPHQLPRIQLPELPPHLRGRQRLHPGGDVPPPHGAVEVPLRFRGVRIPEDEGEGVEGREVSAVGGEAEEGEALGDVFVAVAEDHAEEVEGAGVVGEGVGEEFGEGGVGVVGGEEYAPGGSLVAGGGEVVAAEIDVDEHAVGVGQRAEESARGLQGEAVGAGGEVREALGKDVRREHLEERRGRRFR